MDVWDYVNTQGHKTAAFLDAYARTNPVIQQAAEWYRIANQSDVLTILKIAYIGHDLTSQFVDIGQHLIAAELQHPLPDVSHLADIADEFKYDPGLNVSIS